MSSFTDKKIAVLGLGLSGRSALRYLLKKGAVLYGLDRNQALLDSNEEILALQKQGVKFLNEGRQASLPKVDQLIVSPGVSPGNPIYQMALANGIEILGEVELACREMSNPCVAITGSNGKTTTTLLTEHVLNFAGIKAKAFGNIGTPLTAALEDSKDDVIVLELSSWQLETLKSQVFDGAVILNITPNHLDRHGTMEAYAKAKLCIKKGLKPGKPLFMGIDCYQKYGTPEAIPFGYGEDCIFWCDFHQILHKGEVQFSLPEKLRGRKFHDVENMLASYLLCLQFGVDGATFSKAFSSFQKPPHRIEFIKKISGVSYYNDSKATSLEAVVKAVDSMEGSVILIAGGVHKGAAYSPWVESFGGKVKVICAIGLAAEQIQADIGEKIPVQKCHHLEEAVVLASKLAKKGENVLLSPGCSSYDMFKNYEQRGDEFTRIVLQSLPNEEKNDE